jgi:CRISPR-associated protein Cas5d
MEGGKTLEHPEAKHLETFKRRASRGQYFHHPYLGCREFPASFRLLGDDEGFPPCPTDLQGERDWGYALWDIEFTEDPAGAVVESSRGARVKPQARFFQVVMREGIIQVPSRGETRG